MTTGNPIFDEFELSGLAAILPPEVTRLIRDQQQIINNLVDRVASLESRLEGVEVQLEELQTTTGRERAFDRQRISKLENRDKTETSATGPAYADKLCKLMSQSRTHQISVSNAAKLLGITTRHAHRLKPSLLADSRFAIVKDPHHKQRHLIRII